MLALLGEGEGWEDGRGITYLVWLYMTEICYDNWQPPPLLCPDGTSNQLA